MKRLRQFRTNEKTRKNAHEIYLKAEDFILPVFIKQNISSDNGKEQITGLPDVYRYNFDEALNYLNLYYQLGGRKVLLFAVIDEKDKDDSAQAAWQEENPVIRFIPLLKKTCPDLVIITDVCLCGYTKHGHCGVISETERAVVIDNDATLPLLAKTALAYSRAGADYVAPSAMMDGQVEAISAVLAGDDNHAGILSYSIKYASSFYGPFRNALDSTPAFGDRKTYQMDFRNLSQAFEEAKADIQEGADWLMVKPAGPYLDVVYRIKQEFPDIPLTAYQVSGEFAMLKYGHKNKILDFKSAYLESLYAIKRAGADFIISYGAVEALKFIHD